MKLRVSWTATLVRLLSIGVRAAWKRYLHAAVFYVGGIMLVISSVVKDRGWILPYWLQAVLNLDWPKLDISLLFLDDASRDRTGKMLEKFVRDHQNEYASVTLMKNSVPFDVNVNSRETRNRHALYRHLAEMRNMMIERAISLRAGLQLSLDSDILPAPWLPKMLARHRQHYVSSIVLNDNSKHFEHPFDYTYPRGRYTNFAPAIIPARMRSDDGVEVVADGMVFAHRLDYPMNSLIQVGMSGACYMVDSVALNSGARFGFHPFGEDAWYCLELGSRGIPIYADTTVRCVHVMEPKDLKRGMQVFDTMQKEGER